MGDTDLVGAWVISIFSLIMMIVGLNSDPTPVGPLAPIGFSNALAFIIVAIIAAAVGAFFSFISLPETNFQVIPLIINAGILIASIVIAINIT